MWHQLCRLTPHVTENRKSPQVWATGVKLFSSSCSKIYYSNHQASSVRLTSARWSYNFSSVFRSSFSASWPSRWVTPPPSRHPAEDFCPTAPWKRRRSVDLRTSRSVLNCSDYKRQINCGWGHTWPGVHMPHYICIYRFIQISGLETFTHQLGLISILWISNCEFTGNSLYTWSCVQAPVNL